MTGEKSKVTVLMPVYNGEKYLAQAMDSILNQIFTDFEFLIIDDGSVDGSMDIIRKYNDQRIKIVKNEENLGLVDTLNKGLELANSKYIARMDCDDVSLPERLKKQVEYMEAHEDVGICGTWYKIFGDGNKDRVMQLPVEYEALKTSLFFNSYLGHPTVMMRKVFIDKYNLRYDSTHLHAEDYGLWTRCSFLFPIVNIPEVLLHYRISPNSVCQNHQEQQRKTVRNIHKSNLTRLGIQDVDEETLKVQQYLVYFDSDFSEGNLIDKVEAWLQTLKVANKMTQCYPEPYFSNLMDEKLAAVCRKELGAGCGEQLVYVPCAQSKTGMIPVIVHKACNMEWED